MADDPTCSRCGALLLAGAPGGHCLRCLLGFGLETNEDSAPSRDFAAIPAEEAGDSIGSYKIVERIGEGGCGVVYLAEQERPLRRRVALKIIKLGMDTKAVVARFEAERQMLALMDHPNIAKVFDAGATATGRPYFVMELVEGERITDYCSAQRLSIVQRLKLFLEVCDAVQHAHQKGVIHRDLKPSNILVVARGGAPAPKVIDFGIAKATTDQLLTDNTCFTAFEQFIGTPAYMSPEQAAMGALEIDTRSDVYSLGVLLYELLTGQPPFDANALRRAALEEVLRTIREQEPPRPSTRAPALRGDLDWVVMKSLEKDRRQRYQSPSELASDLERFLVSMPVTAHPPSKWHKFQKWTARNRRRLIDSGLAAAVLLAILVPAWFYDRRAQARKAAALSVETHELLFTNTPHGSWRYSELVQQHPKGAMYFPTSTSEYAGAHFRGYVTFGDCAGLTNPATNAGPAFLDSWGNTGYQIFTTWVLSASDRTLNLDIVGDDGHSLFVDGEFRVGAGQPAGVVSNTVTLTAHVPRELTLAIYNSVGGWFGYVGLGPWHGLEEGNWSNVLNNVPGLIVNADGFPPSSARRAK